MRRFSLVFVLFFSFLSVFAQEELNAVVSINAEQVQSSNNQIFKTLETSLLEFINQTKWTNKTFLSHERINCAFNIIISEQTGNNFKASLLVQSTRPIYDSSYHSPVVNIIDSDFSFRYNEYDPLLFNPNSFDSNLVSTIVFYVYTILGIDADTYALKGGEEYFKLAQNIVVQGQSSGGGWKDEIGKANRFSLNDNLLSSKFGTLRSIYYDYHRKGLDSFSKNEKESKKLILNSILKLDKLFNITVGNNMIRFFIDAKSDEIVKVFSDGVSIGKEERLRDLLKKVSPTLNKKWSQIKD